MTQTTSQASYFDVTAHCRASDPAMLRQRTLSLQCNTGAKKSGNNGRPMVALSRANSIGI